MKNLLKLWLLIIPIAFTSNCSKEPIVDHCDVSEEAKEWFADDAYVLTMRALYDDSIHYYSSYKDSIEIPIGLYAYILSKLGAVYDNYKSVERDSIFEIRKIHAERRYINGQLQLSLKKGVPWVSEFILGLEINSNETVRKTFKNYNINYDGFLFESGTTLGMRATVDTFYNLYALSSALENLNGVKNAEPSITGGLDAPPPINDIQIYYDSDTTKILFDSAYSSEDWWIGVTEDCRPHFIGY